MGIYWPKSQSNHCDIPADVAVIDAESLDREWKEIGGGEFGNVYKVRQLRWGYNVAIKLLCSDGTFSDEVLVQDAMMMRRLENPYITRVLGFVRGNRPDSDLVELGMIMELMENGSLASLQKTLNHLPPWPLVFRLVHQVALGMKYLHGLTPDAVIHKNLKPHHILLDTDLNAQITDFGLAKFANKRTDNRLKRVSNPFYAPPEFFVGLPGGADWAYDVYSYAILVWSILNTGKFDGLIFQPFNGERPPLEYINGMQAAGLEELVDLMKKCWRQKKEDRLRFTECTAVTERLYEMHRPEIHHAVYEVQTELEVTGKKSNKVDDEFSQNREMDEKPFGENWTNLGEGGFGQVFKARHRQWRKDVAIKILDDAPGLQKGAVPEAEMMLRAEGPYIMKVLGIFRGRTPKGRRSEQSTSVGLVMDVMERGSLFTLQRKRNLQLLPWALVFRLVHQVAVGMNFLHSLKPHALIHKDLKLENILLDDDLNVKITDFGLAKFANKRTTFALKGAGTLFYAPPEAFKGLPGGATCAYDVYSYAILVWAILNPDHNEAWADAPGGVRPSLEEVKKMKVPGLEDLVELMVRCWNQNPMRRPTFAECTAVTEDLYEKNKLGIDDAVRKVQQEQDGTVIRKDTKRDFHRLTLDTNTAHRYLSLSEHNKKVTGRRSGVLIMCPDHPDRFDEEEQVLCTESLTGRCYWEVEWSGMVEIAVTYRDISRKGDGKDCLLGWNDKSWSLFCSATRYNVRHNSKLIVLTVRPSGPYVGRVVVDLDWKAGILSFYEVSPDTLTLLHTFRTKFTEALYAGFYVYPDLSSSVSLCEQI